MRAKLSLCCCAAESTCSQLSTTARRPAHSPRPTRRSADIEGVEKKKVLKQEILEQLQEAVFPEKLGRVENVYFRNILVQ